MPRKGLLAFAYPFFLILPYVAWTSAASAATLEFEAGFNAGLGEIGARTSIKPRGTIQYSFFLFPAWNLKASFAKLPTRILVGVLGDYRLVGQTTSPASVSGTNLRGEGYMLGPAVSADLWKINILVSMDFLGFHSLFNSTSAGQRARLEGPLGFRVMAGYMLTRGLSVDAMFSLESFSQNIVGSINGTPAEKITQINYGLGLRFYFDLKTLWTPGKPKDEDEEDEFVSELDEPFDDTDYEINEELSTDPDDEAPAEPSPKR